jgi:hypothetical protein
MDPHRPKVGLADDRVGMAKRYFDGEVRSLREKLSEKDVSLAKASRIQKVCVVSFLVEMSRLSPCFSHLQIFGQCVCVCVSDYVCVCRCVRAHARVFVINIFTGMHTYMP